MEDSSGIEESTLLPDDTVHSSSKTIQPAKLGRRRFLKLFGGTAAALGAAAISFPTVRDKVRSEKDKDPLEKEVSESLIKLKEAYGMELGFKSEGLNSETSKELNLAEKRDVLQWLEKEVSKYPSEYIKDFCKPDLIKLFSYYRDKTGPLPISGNVVTNIEGLKEGKHIYTINLTKGSGFSFGWADDSEFPGLFHHELFHLADNRGSNIADIHDWNTLNPEGRYSYATTDSDPNLILSKRPQGFVKAYGRRNELEDRATIAELLFTDQNYIEKLSQEDPIVAAKITKIKQTYFKWSKGKMDEQYWQDLKDRKVDINYWANKKAA